MAQQCQPLSKGCVLYGKFQLIGQDQEDAMKTTVTTSDKPDTSVTLRPEQTKCAVYGRR